MWDDTLADPNWTRKLPFSNDAYTYINVKKSPLKSQLIKGGVSLVTRGTGQSLTLEPYLYSVDPDWPDQGYDGMEFRWFCRQIKPKKERFLKTTNSRKRTNYSLTTTGPNQLKFCLNIDFKHIVAHTKFQHEM